jgi:hypothetical protein
MNEVVSGASGEQAGEQAAEQAGNTGNGVEQAVQTEQVQTPVVRRVPRRWWSIVQWAFLLLVIGWILGVVTSFLFLNSFPNFRKYMFGELGDVTTFTNPEKSLLWLWVFVPTMSSCVTICEWICIFVRTYAPLWLWKKVAEWCSVGFVCEQLRKQVFTRAIVEPLKKKALICAKIVIKRMAQSACVMLLLLFMCQVLESYNFWTYVDEVTLCMRGAMQSVSTI